ncbi:MAG: DUF5114 domain-containing protein [Muribaculaceae bacterium]|nr:DUF5114 domain-containing protein [Muribaculaceae bacterium]
MKLYKYLYPSLLALALAGCDKDGEMLTTPGASSATPETSTKEIILSIDHIKDLALTIYWNENGDITLSNPAVEAPSNAVSNTLQFAAAEDFGLVYEYPAAAGIYYAQFTHQELNNITARIGIEGGTTSPLYLRIKSTIGPNIEPVYSEPLAFTVTTYFIDMSVAKYLDASKGETGRILASPNSDGVYTGFIGAGAWENWWLQEGDNSIWGNLGVDGMSFHISTASNSWNFWYPGTSGCYYTTVDTRQEWWSALLVESLHVSGDLSGEMAYNRKTNQWTLAVDAPSAGTYSIVISGDATLYNTDTTADGPGVARTAGFGGTADALTFGSSASAVSVSLPAGESTLVLDLNDPWNWTIGAGDVPEVPAVPELLYFSGLVDWDGFKTTLTLTDADTKRYGGAHYIDSEWGYRVYTEPDWSAAYKAADGSGALSGTLILAESDGNVPAPAAGLYAMDFNMSALTYELTEIKSLSWAGVNDDWSMRPLTQSADNPEVWSIEFEKTGNTPWGTKLLINGSWDIFFGRGDKQGTLYLRTDSSAQGFEGDNELAIGKTYIMTVDLGKQTYTFTEK